MEATNEIILQSSGVVQIVTEPKLLLHTLFVVSNEPGGQKGKVSKMKLENKIPLFYTKPIFTPKKYDLL